MGWHWTWLFRRRCGAIATAVSDGNEIRVTLCQRRRWHRGECDTPIVEVKP